MAVFRDYFDIMRILMMNTADLSAGQIDEMRQALPVSRRLTAKLPESVVAAWLTLGALYRGNCENTDDGLEIVKENHLPFTHEAVINAGLQWEWTVGEHGKPFSSGVLCNGVQLYTSLSHSGGFAATAIDTVEIGLDIQVPTHLSAEQMLRISRRFHPNEREMLEQNMEQLSPTFYRLWAAKESVIKLDGRGLAVGLGSFFVESGNAQLPDGRTAAVTELEYNGVAVAAAHWK